MGGGVLFFVLDEVHLLNELTEELDPGQPAILEFKDCRPQIADDVLPADFENQAVHENIDLVFECFVEGLAVDREHGLQYSAEHGDQLES